MNYTKLFAKGGKIDTKVIKSEIARIFMLEDSPEKVEQLWQDAVNTYGSEEGVLSEIFKQVGDNPSDESVQKAMMNVLNYTPMEESQMFKCGGKLQQLVTKFGKGGGVDCGCGGIKLETGGPAKVGEYNKEDFFNDRGAWETVHLPNGDVGYARNYRPRAFRFGPVTKNLNQVLITYDENGTPRASSREIKGFFNPNRVKLDTTYNTANNTRASKDFIDRMNFALEGVAPERPQSKQEGGTVELTPLPGHDVDTRLTRRQARELARVNGMSENNEQFSFAMANAMNAARAMGLRGQEARQRAREMAAGITPAERSINVPTASTFGNITPIKEGDLRSQTPTQVSVQEPISQPIASTQEQPLDNLSFAQAFAQSRKSGAKTFNWRGKSYGTNLAKNNQNQNDISNRQSSESVSRRGNLGYPAPNTREPIRIETENGAYGYDNNGNYFKSTNVVNPNTQTSRGNFWRNFVNATLNAQSAELPVSTAVMAASGLHKDRNGNWYQEQTDEDRQLGKNLALLGAAGALGGSTLFGSTTYYPMQQALTAAPKPFLLPAVSPVLFKQGGQLGKDISKTLKCEGKVKKAQNGESLYELPEVVVEPEWKTLEQTGFFKKNNDPIKFETEDNVNQLITSPKGTISLNIRHNDTPKQDSTFTVMAKRPNSEQFSVTRTYSYPGGDTNAKPYYVDDIDEFERAKKWWNYYKNKTK